MTSKQVDELTSRQVNEVFVYDDVNDNDDDKHETFSGQVVLQEWDYASSI